jgi:hypothetical protein
MMILNNHIDKISSMRRKLDLAPRGCRRLIKVNAVRLEINQRRFP